MIHVDLFVCCCACVIRISMSVGYTYGILGGMGITAGAHRYWAHKTYKAKWQLQLLLTICNTIAFQNSIYEWVRDHR